MLITIPKSHTADTRSCDFTQVSKEQLLLSSQQHIGDVAKGIAFFKGLLDAAAAAHDHDKISGIDSFHADFITGFKGAEWYANHVRVNRHHINSLAGVREDVNLIDVLEMIVDCVMAGMGRTGQVTPLTIDPAILMEAFLNTAKLIADQVVVTE